MTNYYEDPQKDFVEGVSTNGVNNLERDAKGELYDLPGKGILIAAYVFAFLGGYLGVFLAADIFLQKVAVEQQDGKVVKFHKYKKSTRMAAIGAFILSCVVSALCRVMFS